MFFGLWVPTQWEILSIQMHTLSGMLRQLETLRVQTLTQSERMGQLRILMLQTLTFAFGVLGQSKMQGALILTLSSTSRLWQTSSFQMLTLSGMSRQLETPVVQMPMLEKNSQKMKC